MIEPRVLPQTQSADGQKGERSNCEIMSKFKEYHESDDWEMYVERLEFYFVANDITDEPKKKATLLSVCGAATYKLMCDLVAPAKPKDKTFKQLKEVIQKHLKPKPSVIVQRYKFNTRSQIQGESVAEFVANLRNIAKDCNFGAALSDSLRDRLVCGVGSERVQRRLLAEVDLTFDNAFSIATAMEAAERNANEIHHKFAACETGEDNSTPSDSNMAENVNKIRVGDVGSRSKDKSKLSCYFCDRPGHKEADCRFKQKLELKLLRDKARKDDQESDSTLVVKHTSVDSGDSDDSDYAIFRVTCGFRADDGHWPEGY